MPAARAATIALAASATAVGVAPAVTAARAAVCAAVAVATLGGVVQDTSKPAQTESVSAAIGVIRIMGGVVCIDASGEAEGGGLSRFKKTGARIFIIRLVESFGTGLPCRTFKIDFWILVFNIVPL